MTRNTLANEVKQLQYRHWQLQQQLQQLQDSKRSQQLRHAISMKWCEAVDYMAQSIHTLAFPDEPLQHSSEDLQQQLLELSSSCGDWPTLEQLMQPDSNTICPPTDPVLPLLRRVVSPAVQQHFCADDITPGGMCGVLRETYTSLAIKLQRLQAAVAPDDRQFVLLEMAGLWDRTLQATAALFLKGGREHVIEQAYCFNLETLQLEPEAAARHVDATAAAMVPALGLSKQQEELIAVTLRIYSDIMNSIVSDVHAEQQQLQEQPAPMEDMCSPSGSGASSSTTVSSQVDRLWGEQKEQQQAQATRFMTLMHQEHWARAVASMFVCGSLTYEQLSKAAVLSWPFPLRYVLLGTAIMRQRESRSPQQSQSSK